MLAPAARKLALTAHVVASVGWLGAVGLFLALSVAGLTSEDPQMVRAAYLAMDLTAWSVLVPLALASLLTGLVQSLGTTWGLFQHYWVVVKLLYTQTIGFAADLAAAPTSGLDALRSPSPALHAGAALLVLLMAAVLSVYKPRGMTRYGQRERRELVEAR